MHNYFENGDFDGDLMKSIEKANFEGECLRKKTRQLIYTLTKLQHELVEVPKSGTEYEKIDFAIRFDKDFKRWQKETKSVSRELFLSVEIEKRSAEKKRIDKMADEIDQLHTSPMFELTFDLLRKHEAYIKLLEYIDVLQRGGPGDLKPKISKEDFKAYFVPTFYEKPFDTGPDRMTITRFDVLIKEINKHLLSADDRHIAVVANKIYKDWVLQDKVKSFKEWLFIFYAFMGRGSTYYKPQQLEGFGEYLRLFECFSK
ncbi:MAG TPA: hypothetical protein PLQ82_11335 [Desulfobacteraceae bacterium]|nr:hypothetical protein [Desulfobacteraceae bacterium]